MAGCQWTLPNYINPDCVDIEMWHEAWDLVPGVKRIIIKWEGQELQRDSLFSKDHVLEIARQGGAHRELNPHGLEIHFDDEGTKKLSTTLARHGDSIRFYTLPPPKALGHGHAYEMFTEAVRNLDKMGRVATTAIETFGDPKYEV